MMVENRIGKAALWGMGSAEQFAEWLALAEQARSDCPILQGLTLREILTAQRYEWLDARMIGEEITPTGE